ncbi:hypothetical protein [Salisaeta longa]|uniref:hypothetical protein n=1 Tax=Salisaeta longa TaxID=503170 RepID=UPI00058DEAC3|nr:hypothetical protein [Salisaeta longa]
MKRTSLLFLALTLGLIACATSGSTQAHTNPGASKPSSEDACPAGSQRAFAMVENFLTNPTLSDARQETGTTGLRPAQTQLVQDESTCHQLDGEFGDVTDEYAVSYYKVGSFYFATQILKQPDDPNIVASGLSFIYVLDSNLNFIKGYSG